MSQAIILSNYSIQKWQDLAFGAAAWTPPTTLYGARFSTMPTAAGTGGVEAAYTGYARIAIAQNSANWPASTSQKKVNGAGFQWASALSAETHAGYGFYDSDVGGSNNLIALATYASPVAVGVGGIPFVAAGDFSLTIKNSLTTPANGGVFPSNFLVAAWLDHIFGATAFTPAGTHYMARYTATPTAVNGSGTEAAYTAYARKSFTNDLTTGYVASATQTKKNKSDIVPTAAGSGPTTITAWAIYDALTTGNELLVLVSANALTLLSGATDDVPANAMAWKVSNS